ncbi:hypothetical protein DFH27DRAFT_615601 [Peziza echinospora]|nr:hypothetical protein DFH27DRAFT_615601 [Peziza echinospora]
MPLINQNDHNYPNVARLSKDDLHAQLLLLDIKPEELDKVLERLVTARKINPHECGRKKETRKNFAEMLEAEAKLGAFRDCNSGLDYEMAEDDAGYARMQERGYMIFLFLWRYRVGGKKKLVPLYARAPREYEERRLDRRLWAAFVGRDGEADADGEGGDRDYRLLNNICLRMQAEIAELKDGRNGPGGEAGGGGDFQEMQAEILRLRAALAELKEERQRHGDGGDEGAMEALQEQVTRLGAQVETLSAECSANTAAITTNTAAIAANTDDIGTLSGQVAQNTAAIAATKALTARLELRATHRDRADISGLPKHVLTGIALTGECNAASTSGQAPGLFPLSLSHDDNSGAVWLDIMLDSTQPASQHANMLLACRALTPFAPIAMHRKSRQTAILLLGSSGSGKTTLARGLGLASLQQEGVKLASAVEIARSGKAESLLKDRAGQQDFLDVLSRRRTDRTDENKHSSRSALILEFAYSDRAEGSLTIVDLPGHGALGTRIEGGAQDPDSRWIATELCEVVTGLRKWLRGQAVVGRELGPIETYVRTHVLAAVSPGAQRKVLLLGLARDDGQVGAYLSLLESLF